MKKIFLRSAIAIGVLALAGCVVQQPMPTSPPPAGGVVYEQAPPAQPAEIDLMPPLPTFTTIADCELAYGPGQCGSGAALYSQASMAPPPNAATWFAPFAFGVMTGVLVNQFFAPPTVYYSTVHYHSYLAPVVVERYRVVTPVVVEHYRRAPPEVRRSVWNTGPIRYDTRHNSFVGSPYGSGYSHPVPAPRPVVNQPPPRPPETRPAPMPGRPPATGRPVDPVPVPGARPPSDRPGAPGWQNPTGRPPYTQPAPANAQDPTKGPPPKNVPRYKAPVDPGQNAAPRRESPVPPAAAPQQANRPPARPAVEPTRRVEKPAEATRQSAPPPAPQPNREVKQNNAAKEKKPAE